MLFFFNSSLWQTAAFMQKSRLNVEKNQSYKTFYRNLELWQLTKKRGKNSELKNIFTKTRDSHQCNTLKKVSFDACLLTDLNYSPDQLIILSNLFELYSWLNGPVWSLLPPPLILYLSLDHIPENINLSSKQLPLAQARKLDLPVPSF